MRYLIIGGAGAMGAGTARDLLSPLSDDVTQVIVADSSKARLDELKAAFPGDNRLAVETLDVRDHAAMVALMRKADICINGVPTLAGFQMGIFAAALESGKPYADYGGLGIYTVKQKAEHERWAKAGATAVISLGADPGLSNILCRAAADRLDEIDRIGLYWVARLLGPENPILVPPYAVSTIIAEYAHPSSQFLDGRLVQVPPRALEEVIDLPEPYGRATFMCTPHSEPLTVPFARGIAEKGIREMTWKLSLPQHEHDAWIALAKAGFGDLDDPVDVDGASVKPGAFLDALLRRHRERNKAQIPDQEYNELHFSIGEGRRDGKPARVTAKVSASPDPLYAGYTDAATSMCMSIGAQLMLRGRLQPGVHAPEEFFHPADFFAEIAKRNFKVEIEETVTSSI
jgi:saccharopine dehydrogenase-like NADP-dependent oxidoreductase